MSDSKIIYLFPPRSGKLPANKRRRKREIEPEFSYRKRSDMRLVVSKNGTTHHYYNKLKGLFHKYGLWQQIVIDEGGVILAGSRQFKALEHRAYLVPTFQIAGLSPVEKAACGAVSKDWERDLARKKFWAEERSHD